LRLLIFINFNIYCAHPIRKEESSHAKASTKRTVAYA